MKISVNLLKRLGACSGGIRRFKAEFPRGISFQNEGDLIERMASASTFGQEYLYSSLTPDISWLVNRLDEALDKDTTHEMHPYYRRKDMDTYCSDSQELEAAACAAVDLLTQYSRKRGGRPMRKLRGDR